MSSDFDKLLTEPWLVDLTPETRSTYALMVGSEQNWIAKCAKLGCTPVPGRGRSSVLLVPTSVTPPLPPDQFHAEWESVCYEAALAQGKHLTIGSRTSTPPRWLWPDGSWHHQRPDDEIVELRQRTSLAARGQRISAAQAIDYLSSRAAALEAAVANSKRNGQQKRAKEQAERLEDAQASLAEARDLVARAEAAGEHVSAQIVSGKAWKLHAKWRGGAAFSFSVPAVGILPVADGVECADAPTRTRATEGREIVVADLVRFIFHRSAEPA